MTINLMRTVALSAKLPQGDVVFQTFDSKEGPARAKTILEGNAYPRLSILSDVKTIVDVGANVGAASVFFALQYPNADIYAFEPFSNAYQLLETNTTTFPKVQKFQYGLLDREKRSPIFLNKLDPALNSVSRGAAAAHDTEEITLKSADSVFSELHLNDIDILKIDTVGCEVPILKSLKPWLARTRVIYLEYRDDNDRRRLDSILADTHILVRANIVHPHRGELCFARASDLNVDSWRVTDPTLNA
ncbi:MAG: FkbM family methyltransferase [Pirellula sp.]